MGQVFDFPTSACRHLLAAGRKRLGGDVDDLISPAAPGGERSAEPPGLAFGKPEDRLRGGRVRV
jgi:hypothetical protein